MPQESETADTVVVAFVGTLLGAAITGGIAVLWPWLENRIGEPASVFVCFVVVAFGIALFVSYKRYFDMLGCGDDPLDSYERAKYNELRANLENGGRPAQLYADQLTRLLDAVDHFFGDADLAERTLFPHAFGLKARSPLWTAPAFDRCLLLALVYPAASIFIIWAASGHVGPAEHALGFGASLTLWRRTLAICLICFAIFALRKGIDANGWKRLVWFIVAMIGSLTVALTGAINSAFVLVFAPVCAFVFYAARATYNTGIFALALAFAPALALGVSARASGAFGLTGVASVAIVLAISVAVYVFAFILFRILLVRLAPRDRKGPWLIAGFAVMLCSIFGVAFLLSSGPGWGLAAPILLFLGLLALLNAPFDWVSLGLTRALLRRGIELGGWWPYVLALTDAVLATIVIAVLAMVMIAGAELFGLMESLGHGKPTLVVPALLNGIGRNPSAPEFWWVYALLLSTMIPSLINLVIGGVSFVRGIPGMPTLLLRYIPEGRSVSRLNRNGVALALSGQWLVGGLLGVAAQFVLVWLILGKTMLLIGFDLLGMARWVDKLF
jgi:hypothetical protein